MTSPLSSVPLFHLGPVPITSAVAVTWAIMAVLSLGGIVVTRRLALAPSRMQAAFELIVESVDSQILRHDAGRAIPLSRFYRHLVRLHLRRQLVPARPRG